MFRKKDCDLFVIVALLCMGLVTACNKEVSNQAQNVESDCPYRLPFDESQGDFIITQGSFDDYTHFEGSEMEHAIDIDLPEGTEILAAREGIVSYSVGRFRPSSCGDTINYANLGNYVVIDHGDGTSALYLHLRSTEVDVGHEIEQGELIGYSGRTGWTDCNPHLHFQIQETGPLWFTQSVSFCGFSDDLTNQGVPPQGAILLPGDEIPEISGEVIPGVLEPDRLDLSDPYSVAQWTIYAIMGNHPEIFVDLVGPRGAAYAGYGMGFDFLGFDNGQQIWEDMATVLSRSTPVCVGFRIEPDNNDKLFIIFRNMNLGSVTEWAPDAPDYVQFLFFKFNNQYELVVIGAIADFAIEWETENLESCNFGALTENQSTTSASMPTTLLNRNEIGSVVHWVSYALANNDISVFEQLITNTSISYGTGFAGGRHEMSRETFLGMLDERLDNGAICHGYSGDNDSLWLWTSGWTPEWIDNVDYVGSVSYGYLNFRFYNHGSGLALSSAYMSPSYQILESPSVESEPCPEY